MPWKVDRLETQRGRFVIRALEPGANISALCRDAGITRPTGYKWIARYKECGISALEDRGRKPARFRKLTAPELVMEIVRIRTEHPTWGGKKIRGYLLRRKQFKKVPVARTIDRILKRCGLVNPKVTRSRRALPEVEIVQPKHANQVWTIDFKGWWLTKDGTRCEPLTIRDEHSRYIIGIFALNRTTYEAVKRCLIECFERYGLPEYIRSDNGHPFISLHAMAGLTRLSAWWLKLGITPNRIAPASPHMNGAHERMHRDMKRELQLNPAQTLRAEQERFDYWRQEFNTLRPHEALANDVPADRYSRSLRRYTSKETTYIYPPDFIVRKVTRNGEISWSGRFVSVSKSLAKEYIGVEILDTKTARIWYTDFCLGVSDANLKTRIVPVPVPLHKEKVPKAA